MIARILVVEEHTPSLVLMLHALKGRGYATAFATDGATVLSLVREQRPDVLVCDSRLSGADGRQLVREIRREDRLRGIVLLAVLEDARLGVVGGRKTPAGFADHIDKPIDPASFLRMVERNLPPPLRAVRSPLRQRGRRRKSDPAVWRSEG